MKFLVFLACCAYGCLCFAQAPVTVYTQSDCPYCESLKACLNSHGIKYRVVKDSGKYPMAPVTEVRGKVIEGDQCGAIVEEAK